MSFKYNKLWKILIDKDMKKVELRDGIGTTPATLSKLSRNQIVSMEILGKICEYLQCDIGDICEYIPKSQEK